MNIHQQISTQKKILLVDDDNDFRWATSNLLESSGYNVIEAKDGQEAINFLEKDVPDMVLLDYRMPGRDGIKVAEEMRKQIPAVPVVMITAYAEVHSAVKAMKTGVYDYVTKPIDNNDLLFTVKRALEKKDLEQEIEYLRDVLNERGSLNDLMGMSDQVKRLFEHVEKVAPTSFSVLIEGESGTGKELVARAIHNLSKEKEGPFVALDCGAIPETLIESELFGHMKGAFTGAHADKPGQFELANGGTLFLDEVGNLPYGAQQKLLRAVQERSIRRLGAKKARPIQVRIITAANQALEKHVEAGNFRSDLFFRLREFAIKIPSLRERKGDIPYLTKRFLDEAQSELRKKCRGLSKSALDSLTVYNWPGNVRELRNVIRQAVLLCNENGFIESDHLIFSSQLNSTTKKTQFVASSKIYDDKRTLKEIVKSFADIVEKRAIKDAMAQAKGNKSKVAKSLGIDYKTLLRKIKIHQIE